MSKNPTAARNDDEEAPATPRQKQQVRNFGWFLLGLSLLLLAPGAWGTWKGWQTLSWPRVEVRLVDPKTLQAPPDGALTRVPENDAIMFAVTYLYRVGELQCIGNRIEPYRFGFENAAKVKRQRERYRLGTVAQAAYDPSDPCIAYLEPGPSSTALMFLGVGTFIFLCAQLVLRAGRLGIGRMVGSEP